jgi:class 3 adenylate cyclase
VQAALDMVQAVHGVNTEHQAQGLPAIGVGAGLNTGPMCVGDMGSDVRRSYTVIGDAVNLGSRLEGLCKAYGVEIVASESARAGAGFLSGSSWTASVSKARSRPSPSTTWVWRGGWRGKTSRPWNPAPLAGRIPGAELALVR